jgi:hypothetical protein
MGWDLDRWLDKVPSSRDREGDLGRRRGEERLTWNASFMVTLIGWRSLFSENDDIDRHRLFSTCWTLYDPSSWRVFWITRATGHHFASVGGRGREKGVTGSRLELISFSLTGVVHGGKLGISQPLLLRKCCRWWYYGACRVFS